MTEKEFLLRYEYDVYADKLGDGGFGSVYKAFDNIGNKYVAVKISQVKYVNGKRMSLQDEYDATSHLPSNPFVANYSEMYTFATATGECDFSVMQYYPDGDLKLWLHKPSAEEVSTMTEAQREVADAVRPLTMAQKEDIAVGLLQGIAFLHGHNVIHRDLKPGNVMLVKKKDKMVPVITDFGLSKEVRTSIGSEISNSTNAGSFKYSSPEQLNGKRLMYNTDLWSYGAIVYELFTGKSLFGNVCCKTVSAKEARELYDEVTKADISDKLAELPEKWSRIVRRCIVHDNRLRVKSANELLDILGVLSGDRPNGGERKDGDDETVYEEATEPSGDGTVPGVEKKPKGGEEPKKEKKPKGNLWMALGAAVRAIFAEASSTPHVNTVEADSWIDKCDARIRERAEAERKAKEEAVRRAKAERPLPGVFSVSATTKVQFSKGNLTYNRRTQEWAFYEHQYDRASGYDENLISLFTWGYGDWSSNPGTESYGSTFTDWGTRMGDGRTWRTLSKDEWEYLIEKRATSSGIRYAKAEVNGVAGLVVVPDDWSVSTYALSETNNWYDGDFTANVISRDTWNDKLEPAGCVFLPCAGYRNGSTVYYVGSRGNFWSSTASSATNAFGLYFYSDGVNPARNYHRYLGRSVRLVCFRR